MGWGGAEFELRRHRRGGELEGDCGGIRGQPVPVATGLRRAGGVRTGLHRVVPQSGRVISTFTGDNRATARCWRIATPDCPDGYLSPAEPLVSAVCHPCYATLPLVLPESGSPGYLRLLRFRHEPSIDLARDAGIPMREYVRVAAQPPTPRDSWVGYGMEVLDELGPDAADALPTTRFSTSGPDPGSQPARGEPSRPSWWSGSYEIFDDGTAVVSANCHRDHFGEASVSSTSTGEVAQRLAAVRDGANRTGAHPDHGIDSTSWPAEVRSSMGWTEP